MEFLDRLRQKPRAVRARIAFGSAVGVTALVALVWSTTLPARFGELGGTIKEETVEQSATVQNSFDALIESATSGIAPEVAEDVRMEGEMYVPPEYQVGAMDTLGNWKTEEPAPTPEAAKPEQSPVTEDKVILIGTTTKTAQ